MLIVTSGNYAPPFAQHCWQTQREYAERIGAEWLRVTERPGPNPFVGRVDTLMRAVRGKPEDTPLLWLDWDVEVSAAAPSIFELETGPLDFHARPSLLDLDAEFWRPHYARSQVLKGKERHHVNIGVHLSRAGIVPLLAKAVRNPQATVYLRDRLGLDMAVSYELAFVAALNLIGASVLPLDEAFHKLVLDRGPFGPAVENAESFHFIHYAGPGKYPGGRPHP